MGLAKRKKDLEEMRLVLYGAILMGLAIMIISIIAEDYYPALSSADNATNLSNWTRETVINTSAFYKYNISNVNNTLLTEGELKEQGGVCYHWAEYYMRLADKAGYNAKTITMQMSPDIRHEIAVISSSDEYCIIDQLMFSCAQTISNTLAEIELNKQRLLNATNRTR